MEAARNLYKRASDAASPAGHSKFTNGCLKQCSEFNLDVDVIRCVGVFAGAA
jgi:hypothetical protein